MEEMYEVMRKFLDQADETAMGAELISLKKSLRP
jgi:hypothetical protein